MDKAMELLLTPTRTRLAQHLAALDNVRLLDIRASTGPAEDANNWRNYLGRADDLMAMLSMDIVEAQERASPPSSPSTDEAASKTSIP